MEKRVPSCWDPIVCSKAFKSVGWRHLRSTEEIESGHMENLTFLPQKGKRREMQCWRLSLEGQDCSSIPATPGQMEVVALRYRCHHAGAVVALGSSCVCTRASPAGVLLASPPAFWKRKKNLSHMCLSLFSEISESFCLKFPLFPQKSESNLATRKKKKTTNQHDRNTAAKPYMQQKTGTFSGSLSTMQHCQPCLRKAPNSHSFQYSATGTNCFPAMLGCGARALPRHLLLHWCQPRLLLLPAPPLSEPWTTDSASLQHFMHQQSFVFTFLGFKPRRYTGNGWGFCPQAHWTWGGLYCPWGRSVVEQERHGGGWDHRKVQVWWSSEGWGQEGRGGEAGRAAEGGVHFLKERGETGQGWWKLGIQVHAAQQMRSRAKSPKPRFIWIQDPLHPNSS